VKGATAATIPARPYLEQSQKLAESMRKPLDTDLQLKEKRAELAKLRTMLEEKKKELLKVQGSDKSEKQAIEQLSASKAKLEADL